MGRAASSLVGVQDLDAIEVAERVPGARFGAVEIRPVETKPPSVPVDSTESFGIFSHDTSSETERAW
jgi:hypothetical protein